MKINRTTIIMDLLGVFSGIIIFLLCFLETKNILLIDNKMLSGIFTKNFEPVINITLGRNKCYEKLNYFPVINYTFGGIDQSCYFKNSETYKNLTSCKKEDLEKGGINIEKIEEKKIQIWRDKNMCIKRTINLNQTSIENGTEISKKKFDIIQNEKDCNEGYIECGKLSNRTKKLCMLNEKLKNNETNECPLNKIEITDNITDYNDDEKYKILDFIDGYKMVISNKFPDGNIILDFKISEGEFPCLEVERFSNLTKVFPTLKNIKYYGCNYNQSKGDIHPYEKYLDGFDDRYIKIDSITKQILFRDNDLDLNYRELPTIYDKNNNIIWKNDIDISNFSLFYRDYYNDKENCDNFIIFEKNTVSLNESQYWRLFASLCNILILVVFISILGLMQVVIAIYHTLFFSFKIFFSYTVLFVNLYLISKSEKSLPSLIEFIDNSKNCFDKQSIEIIRRYKIRQLADDLKDLYKYEKYCWYAYFLFNFIQTLRLINKIYVRFKNKYRRDIVIKEIGKRNAQKIFEIMRKQKLNDGIMEWDYDLKGKIKLKDEDKKPKNIFIED